MAVEAISIGFRGVFAAWVAHRISATGQQVNWPLAGRDFVTGSGRPTAHDVLYPDRRALKTEHTDSGILSDVQRLTPHLVRPVRLVDLTKEPAGLFSRMISPRKRLPGDQIDLASHQAGRPLAEQSGTARLERCAYVDSQRLTVALTRDFVSLGGTIFPDDQPSAGAATIRRDPADLATFRPKVSLIIRRPYREDFAYRLTSEDGAPFMALPIDQDLLLAERSINETTPERALADLSTALDRWFAGASCSEDTIASNIDETPADFTCIQDFRQQGTFWSQQVEPVSGSGILSSSGPDTLVQGSIGESFGQFANKLAANYSHLDAAYIRALVARHGPDAPEVLGECHRESDLGEDFGGGLRAREARWFLDQEHARTADDLVSRRGQFGLKGADVDRLQGWMDRGAPLR